LPWQRVVGKKDARRAQVNIDDPDHAALQRALLESEGVVFDANGCISLREFGWHPRTVVAGASRAGSSGRRQRGS
jgi:methylated-DNA-protein-cysteine methyltransferase-like protein